MRRPLRVAVLARAVTPLHGVGGLERSVNDLVRHLAAHEVDVTLVTPPPAPIRRQTEVDPFAVPHITVRHVSYVTFPLANRRGTTVLDRSTAYPIFGMRAGRLVRSLVHDGRIDIVHGFGASVLGYAIARSRERAPLVFNPQGLEEFGATAPRQPLGKRVGYWPLQRAVRICSRAADCVIATDASLESTVAGHLHVRRDHLRTIPNGIDLVHVGGLAGPAEGRLIRERYGIAAGETLLLSVGRLEHNKGFDLAIAALARAAHGQSALVTHGWRWVICGSGPQKHELEHAVAAHSLDSHVLFTGRTTDADLHAWYEAATLFVHPTRYEGSSLVTLEAMSHRKPIVATRAGGLPDKVRLGENGWLVEPDDVPGLAAAIEEAVADPVRLIAMGTRSRQIVEREFSWSVLIQRYLDLYDDLLSRQRPL
jgi:glycosyltransferase involved in cell wall biosynthesis